MRKWNKITYAILIVATTGLLAACSKPASEPTTTDSTTVSSSTQTTTEAASTVESSETKLNIKENGQTDTEEATLKDQIELLSSIIGLTDDKVVEKLGKGDTEPEAGTAVLTREYNRKLLGEDVAVSVSFDENKVNNINMILTGTDFDAYVKQATEQLGEYTDTEVDTNNTEGSGMKAYLWDIGGNTFKLMTAYGSIGAEIYKPV